MTVIYLDVLIILNLYVTFFLIKSTSCFLHLKPSNYRVFSGSILGGLSSLLIFLPEMNGAVSIGVKLFLAVIIIFIVYGFINAKRFLKNTLVFFLVNILFAGGMLLLWLFCSPLGMYYNNGYAYFDISFFMIVISTAISYAVLRIVRLIIDRKNLFDRQYTIRIENNGSSVEAPAIADTGNSLVDFFSGLPVIICDIDFLKPIISNSVISFSFSSAYNSTPPSKARIIPYSTINGDGYITIVKAEKITISDGTESKAVNAMLGISKNELKSVEKKAIFNPKILN